MFIVLKSLVSFVLAWYVSWEKNGCFNSRVEKNHLMGFWRRSLKNTCLHSLHRNDRTNSNKSPCPTFGQIILHTSGFFGSVNVKLNWIEFNFITICLYSTSIYLLHQNNWTHNQLMYTFEILTKKTMNVSKTWIKEYFCNWIGFNFKILFIHKWLSISSDK